MFMCMLLEMLINNRRFWLSIQRKNHMFVKEVVSSIVKYTYKIGIWLAGSVMMFPDTGFKHIVLQE